MNVALAISLVVFLVAAVPVAISMVLASTIAVNFFTNVPLLVVAQKMLVGLDSFALVAIPLFILSGSLMAASGISERLVDLAKSVVGGLPGGLACSCVLTCLVFASVSGSSVATTFAVGTILIPAMIKHGYPIGHAAALQATSAELGAIIPPSITFILYGVATNTSIGQLFLAGVGPGLLIAALLIIYQVCLAKFRGVGRGDSVDRKPLRETLPRAGWALLMPVVILGGIYGGIFTATEAAGVATIYALIVGFVVYRRLTIKGLCECLTSSAVATAIVMIIISAAGLFSFIITRSGLPSEIAGLINAAFDNKYTFLLGINIFLLAVGMVIETSAAILILAPILAPVAIAYGVDPVHFGLIMSMNLAMGMCTPPIGVNLFAVCTVARVPLDKIIRPLLPLLCIMIFGLLLVTYIPQISIGLVDIFYR